MVEYAVYEPGTPYKNYVRDPKFMGSMEKAVRLLDAFECLSVVNYVNKNIPRGFQYPGDNSYLCMYIGFKNSDSPLMNFNLEQSTVQVTFRKYKYIPEPYRSNLKWEVENHSKYARLNEFGEEEIKSIMKKYLDNIKADQQIR